MHKLTLSACTATPFGAYLKALGIFRLISEQRDPTARGHWDGNTFVLESVLDQDQLAAFFLNEYQPSSILAPWNGGSGFYPKDNKHGISGILKSTQERFSRYREDLRKCQSFPEVQQGKENPQNEDERRTAILRRCRNVLSDSAVAWFDAAVGIAADGSRAFAPVLGTGGNEGRLDYTNNFMSRIALLLIAPPAKLPVGELFINTLIGDRITNLQDGAAGQFDPGRAGGANQGPDIKQDTFTNPWDLVLTLEGAVAWASGIYRRQGTSYRTILCSPFTVRPRAVGYGSASAKDDARAEIWTPLWQTPVLYSELRALLREGRASVQGRPATNALEFAEAARSLGVDRGINRFIRYSLLKRRGDSYVALPVGSFPAEYRSESDSVRELQNFLGTQRNLSDDSRREIDNAIYHVLFAGGKDRMRDLTATVGRALRRIATTTDTPLQRSSLKATQWVAQCSFGVAEVRLAAALASIYDRDAGSIRENLSRGSRNFAWIGLTLCDRMISVLSRRLHRGEAAHLPHNPLGAFCRIHPGDATLFLEGSVDDVLIEDLLFAFSVLDWTGFKAANLTRHAEILPVYAVLKHLFLADEISLGPETQTLRADPRILSLLTAGNIEAAAEFALHRLRIARLRPLNVDYAGGDLDAMRLAASLLIPVRANELAKAGIFAQQESFQAHAQRKHHEPCSSR